MIDPHDQTIVEILATSAAIIVPLFAAQMIAASLESRRDRQAAKRRAQAAARRRRAQIERNRARTTTNKRRKTK